MQVLEKVTEGKLTRWLKKNKIKFKKKYPGELLDRMVFLPYGHLFIIELKRKMLGSLSRRQIKEIQSLRSLGYDVEVHDDADEAIAAIAARLESQRLHEEGHKVRADAIMRGLLSRSRARENKYKPRHNKDSN